MKKKIDKIYEVIADKTLSFGCKVRCFEVDFGYANQPDFIKMFGTFDNQKIKPAYCKKTDLDIDGFYYDNTQPIGHPVMIGDVLDWCRKNEGAYANANIINHLLSSAGCREKLRKPIEEQSEECINFIYGLIK